MLNTDTLMLLTKHGIGIFSNREDQYLQALINTAMQEIEDTGIVIDGEDTSDLSLVATYATWLYAQRKNGAAMPRFLQYRLHNRLLKECGKNGS